MQELDFWLDDISALANYISLQSPITFGSISPRVTTVQVVGKSGDLHIDHDAYDNIPGTAKCYALAENVSAAMADVNAFLFAQKGYRRLKTSDDILYYREARIANAGEIAARLALLNPFTINFDCKPFRRLISGDDAIFVQSGDVITNPTGFTAEPLIYFSAIDSGTIQIGNYTVTVNSGIPDYAVMDCELWTCYPESGAAGYGYNSYISAARYPLLNVGNNTISWTGGVTVSKIVPRWRSL
jgi:phage-related protein